MSNRQPPRPVKCVTPEGEVVNYPSVYAAAKARDVDPSHVRQAIRQGYRLGGCRLSYADV